MEIARVVIGAIIWAVVAVFIGIMFIYFIRHFQDPEDAPDIFTKCVTWFIYTATTVIIMMLPFDVVCAPESHKFMPIIWQIFTMVLAIMIIAVVPFTMCCYEEDGSLAKRICTGIKYAIGSIVVWLVIIFVVWAVAGYAEVPFKTEVAPQTVTVDGLTEEKIIQLATESEKTLADKDVTIRVTVPVYAVCIVSVVGWVLFLVFGGGGMFTCPFDCILECCFRPKRTTKKQFAEFKAKLKRDSLEILDEIGDFKRLLSEKVRAVDPKEKALSKKQKKYLKELHEDVGDVLDDYEHVRYVEQPQEYNVLLPWCKLIAGIIGLLVAIFWIVQIIIVIVLKQGRFLSDAFVVLDKYAFLGSVLYGVFIGYLAIAVIKGNLKIGTKFLLGLTFYPMEAHATLPNAMLFNGMLYSLASFALIQFAVTCFQSYVYNTSVNALFSNQMKNLMGIKYVFRYLHFVLLGFAALGLVWSLTFQCCIQCYRKKKAEKKMRLKDWRD
ncbi:putative LMBR1 domain-containing protein [Monocercomonoides exilis]|uniref:putative LMBR1 domain-containing protein n=1 Tax=Monocercomonoides exilis TaxID=2049356 RepID=UPI00355A6568|nr:putative LMBR1 domain-containing protein [Monocercomonoides exilis]|eukprot:MONOS_8017.1-p1 / transcript=MONOS_8017.1 / gene=MONOS_8017 / organism=Monocercomonoides_exilis_PA203 / gene_product=LMBR1 integral membrane family protein / transcript_product=LMBR1 integral membrane family protein / location=Mono_scaffold00291:14870-16665(-) / protein_length=493 / sequence_SO=supercontig / SO=protein_coding / is_pseudo=false